MICNGAGEPMCIGGVFGGLNSGIKKSTRNIFLESACFDAVSIRKTSIHHGLRTDAAIRFEKGVDISNTVNVLKRAALLVREIAGGEISSDLADIYPMPQEKKQVGIKYHYLKKLSGKNYHPDAVKRILTALGFEIAREGIDELWVSVPFSKPDISLPADIVEEIVRIDGLDNIDIPSAITISPSVENLGLKEVLKEKVANYLVGQGFNEIFTNSITNSSYFSEEVLHTVVKMINNLSADLDVLRPSMLETGLEVLAYNMNRKSSNLQLFEFGKTYNSKAVGEYKEEEHLSLYITGFNHEETWREKSRVQDFYKVKGLAKSILSLNGLTDIRYEKEDWGEISLAVLVGKNKVARLMGVGKRQLDSFNIKQPVFFLDFYFESLVRLVEGRKIIYEEVPRFPVVQRDLAMVVNRDITYEKLENVVKKSKLSKLKSVRLFDVFESDKLGPDKKSMAVSFTFLDEEKTLTDKETDNMINKLVENFEKELGAEIRK
jgi:phenylalanyl-tRNA synthetase beta chain